MTLFHPVTLAMFGLVLVTAGPLAWRVWRAKRREWRAHAGDVRHCYCNFDEELRYEPSKTSDIVTITPEELNGYIPTVELERIPRTFRNRIAGDRYIRLWRSGDPSKPPIWLCER